MQSIQKKNTHINVNMCSYFLKVIFFVQKNKKASTKKNTGENKNDIKLIYIPH